MFTFKLEHNWLRSKEEHLGPKCREVDRICVTGSREISIRFEETTETLEGLIRYMNQQYGYFIVSFYF